SIDGKEVEKGFLNLKAGSEASKRFYYPLKKGKPYRGFITIAPDKLKIDDTRFFAVYSPPPKKVLIVNGDPGTSLYTNEIYYLERALNPSQEGDSPFRAQTVSPEGLAGRSLDGFSSIILANVGSIKDDALAELTRFVRDGGGLLMTLGDKVIPADYNRIFHTLSPQKIDKPDEQKGDNEGLFLKKTSDSPQGFKELLETKTGNLAVARFYSYFKLLPDKSGNPKTLLTFSNNAPAFVELVFGKGKVILYNSTIDRDWNNLPIQTSYLPFMHQLLNYLGKRGEESLEAKEILVGEPYNFLWNDTSSKIDAARMVTPDNQSFDLVLFKEGKDARASFTRTDLPGFYRLLITISKTEEKSGPKEIEIPFVVNLETKESDLRRLTAKEINDLASPLSVNIVTWQKTEASLIEGKNEEKGVSLWGFILVLLAGTLLAESAVANKQI
ncbi:MAG: hypothetical protein HY730_08085, partial [Candidatus Tectomicrobia bacterium]|nr:hypothetical protein [Candidatus Tectomicrobia bacterium]